MQEHEIEIIKQVFSDTAAVLTGGHFVYTSGKHGSAYVNKDAIYPNPDDVSTLCKIIAHEAVRKGMYVDTVVGPETGAIILSQWTAHHLKLVQPGGKTVHGVYAEKDGKGFVIKRGYDKFVAGRNVLIVEDILNTGGSVKAVVETVNAIGGNIVGVAALCNRGGVTAESIGIPSDTPLFSLLDVTLDMWEEADCPLCRDGVPINTNVGKGREYLARKAK
jgi:orotate phosphoribosyltransferase